MIEINKNYAEFNKIKLVQRKIKIEGLRNCKTN